jgi:DNA-binding GntR family transcriptional regulator
MELNRLRTRTSKQAEPEGEVDRVYRQLRTWLLECEFKPGDFLSEVELARLCSTSRTPVREACNRLSQEKWITRIRHKGYMVPPISIRQIVEIYEYRKLLECFTAERAAQTANADEIARLGKIIETEKRAKATVAEVVGANAAFHIGLAEIARNQRVIDEVKSTLEYVHRLDVLSTQRDTVWIPHGEILNALEARKPALANKAMAAHVDNSRDRMLRLFGS